METHDPDRGQAQAAGLHDPTPEPRARPAHVPPPGVGAPPAFADGAARNLEPGWIGARRVNGLLVHGGLGLFAFLALSGIYAAGQIGTLAFLAAAAALVLGIAAVLALAALWPRWEYARAGYRLLPDRIEGWNGLLWRRTVAVPISRVQYTDVTQGPVERRFGIATLVVHTAGTMSSDVEFPGLPPALANEVRDWLVAETGSDAV